MSLRIIAGEFGGRRIDAPPGLSTRPTGARVREAWFSVLGDRVVDARALDLFAGSGALGLEALSRGAAEVCFVESNGAALSVLRRNIESLGVSQRTRVIQGDALRWVSDSAPGGRETWDVVLADPPYGGTAAVQLVSTFIRRAFAGILCVEHAPDVDFPAAPDWQRRYGDTALSIFLDPMEGAADG